MPNNTTDPSTSIFGDYASMLALMRANVGQTYDLDNPRTAELYQALQVAWTAAMLLALEARENTESGVAKVA